MLDLKDKLGLAPLAGYSDRLFRSMCADFGADFTVSEMVSTRGVIHGQKNTLELTSKASGEPIYGIQLFGSEPADFYQAVMILEEGFRSGRPEADFFDINMGCPVRKVLRQKAGAYLLTRPEQAGRIVSAARKASSRPLGVKIRLGFTDEDRNYMDIGRAAEDNGADFLTVHARTRPQMFSGPPDLAALGRLSRALSIPVCGNGGIVDRVTYQAVRDTGCTCAMIGRAAISSPWIFDEIKTGRVIPARKKIRVFREHIERILERDGDSRGLKKSRSFAMQYIKKITSQLGIPGKKPFLKRYMFINDRHGLEDFFADFEGFCLHS